MAYHPSHSSSHSDDGRRRVERYLPLRDDKVLLSNDAKNRSLRTFLQGAAIDIAVAVAALILASVDSITSQQGLLLFLTALGKTIVTAIAAYVMRQFLDPSRIPTPLPPADPGEPDAPLA